MVAEACGDCPLKGSGILCFARRMKLGQLCSPDRREWVENISRSEAIPEADPPTPEKPLPSIGRRLLNFGKAVVTGQILPHGDADLAARRVAICEACPEFRPSDRTCSQGACGCFIDAKALTHSDCPLGKWPGPHQ